jgi:glyoxylate/hydroxypyruvate reductase
MPAILLAVTGADPQPWAEALRARAPRREIRLWPDGVGEGADIAYACAWYAPRGVYVRLPRLQAIFSLGAGVEHILADSDLPAVPVVRNVEPDLTIRMTEYVVLHVLLQDLKKAKTPQWACSLERCWG